MLYFTLLSIVILVSSLLKDINKLLLYIFIFILFILLGFRGLDVGTDTLNYEAYFDIIKSGVNLPVEIGWVFLNKAVLFFGGSFRIFLLIVSALTLIPIFYVIRRQSVNPLLSIFLFYTLYLYFYSFNISRQALAMSIVFFSYPFLHDVKRVKYLTLILLASLFHYTALIAFPLLFVSKLTVKKYQVFILIIFTVTVGLFMADFVFNSISDIIYSNYKERVELGNLLGNGMYLLVLNCFFLFIYFTCTPKDLYFKIFFTYILASNLLVRIPYSNRVLMYLSIIQVLFLPYYLYQTKKELRPLIAFIIILYAYVIYFRTFGAGEILPYNNTLF